jgi:exopolysaccharide production protein ExoQ
MNSSAIYLASIMGLHLSPTIALLFTIGFIIFLFRRDFREQPNVTSALWLPVIWMLLIGSRSVVQWLAVFGVPIGRSVEEGNPLDALVYFMLIAAGFGILNQRQISLADVFRHNGWLMAFLIYCFIAIAWSDYPFVSFKRWIKIWGHPVMTLILLTETDPQEAIERLMKRSAYVLVPISILLIRYYPGIGRGFDAWTGAPTNNGINTTKNELGWMCMVLGLFFFWHLLQTLKNERSRAKRNELLLIGGFLYLIWWLLLKSDSSTSLISLLVGMLVVVLLGLRTVNKRLISLYLAIIVATLAVSELALGVFGHVATLTGHSATLAGRSELWRDLLSIHTNPIFGVGFESFWLGDRRQKLAELHWWQPNEAHNGYLETYLNLGSIGVFILIACIIATYGKARRDLLMNIQFARYRFGFLVAVVLLNWTEASFRGLSPVWFVFYIIAMDYPQHQFAPAQPFAFELSEGERELVYTEVKAQRSEGFEGEKGGDGSI